MSRVLKETITCVDCGDKRKVTKACLKLVKRCKPCQTIFNRNQARNRYRTIHNISTEVPVKMPKKKKEEPKVKRDFMRQPKPFKKAKPKALCTPAEEAKSIARAKKVFELFDDNTVTDDDW